MSKKRNAAGRNPSARVGTVNPLAAVDPTGMDSDIELSAEEVEATEIMGESEAEITEDPISDIPVGPLGGGIHPSEFDPDSEPLDRFSEDSFTPPAAAEQPTVSKGTIHDSGYVAPEKTGITHLGHPAEPDFNPRDPNKGFYQGIDPVTGQRVYSER